jgi:hypothetical protein
MISKELLHGYEATCYSIINPKIDIYLKKENAELNSFLKEHNFNSWCFITAWNLFSKALSIEENKMLNLLLEADLNKYPIFSAEGKGILGDWPPEISFFVGNISREQAIDLGQKYKQNAIIFGAVSEFPELIVLVE